MSEPPPEEEIPPDMLAHLKMMMTQQFRGTAALLSGCLCAAGRGAEAARWTARRCASIPSTR
jgi:hypothetical protein